MLCSMRKYSVVLKFCSAHPTQHPVIVESVLVTWYLMRMRRIGVVSRWVKYIMFFFLLLFLDTFYLNLMVR